VPGDPSPAGGSVRVAEVIAALSLATDLGMALPLEHGLHSTLVAMRLADRLGVDSDTASQTYYTCLLFYVGCTANADVAAEIFGADDALTRYATPARFGSRVEMVAGFLHAVAPPGGAPLVRARQLAHGLPRVALVFKEHLAAFCEVAEMLTERLGVPRSVGRLFGHVAERWDGQGQPGHARADQIPLPVRIVHVARDAVFQRMLGGDDFATRVIRDRAGRAFDPAIAALLVDETADILALDADASAWDETLASEPPPHAILEDEAIEKAVATMGDFTDLVSPYLVGHSAAVAELAAAAGERCRLPSATVVLLRRAALVHDLGRVAVPPRIWQKRGALTADEWERVRLHPYFTERVLTHSAFLSELAPVASGHHERLDGSGYHRGLSAAALTLPGRVLAAADAYHAMTEPRPHRAPLSPERAAETLGEECRAGLFDADAVGAVLEAAGQPVPRMERPAGLTEREAQVIALLARGLQTKQIAGVLGVSVKTADRHIEHAYRKIGVSTRAAAALFAMEHGLATLGELPIAGTGVRS
jgi:HD-GYP domain-containing protein (c-di-GMP phosphodiesterase class II)